MSRTSIRIDEFLLRAIELHKAGRLADAARIYSDVLASDADNAWVLQLLGVLKNQQGDHSGAVELIGRAIALSPQSRVFHINLAEAYRAMGQFECAAAACRAALQIEPDYAEAHSGLGLALEGLGQREQAIVHFRRAIELEPNHLSARTNLGQAFLELGQVEEALSHCQQAARLAPRAAVVHCNLGNAFRLLERWDEAQAAYREALELDPRLVPAHFKLAGLHEEAGDLKAAEAEFRRVLELQPDHAMARARLATLLRGKLPDADFLELERCLGGSDLPSSVKPRVLFAMANVLDAREVFDHAARCASEANRLTLALANGRRAYSAEEHERFVTNLIDTFDSDTMTRTIGMGHESRQPVFVFGLPRSGTTLIEQVLASHSRMHGAGELRLGRASFERIPAAVGQSGTPMECVGYLDTPSILRLAEEHLSHLQALAGTSCDRAVDKMPDNYMYLGLLATLFPRATFIHCRRDLRDVAVSCWMTDFESLTWANDFKHIAGRFREYVRLMEHWQSVLPVEMHHVDYEEAVADFEPVARRLIAACGMEWEPGCLEFYHSQRPVRTASVAQVRQPVHSRSVGRWRRYESALGELFAFLPPDARASYPRPH